jgi:cold shock CspA family protein
MAFGYISRLVVDRGFGFVVEDGQSEEIEFHRSAIETGSLEQLHEGQRVEFERRADHRDEGRFRAVNVRLVGRS